VAWRVEGGVLSVRGRRGIACHPVISFKNLTVGSLGTRCSFDRAKSVLSSAERRLSNPRSKSEIRTSQSETVNVKMDTITYIVWM